MAPEKCLKHSLLGFQSFLVLAALVLITAGSLVQTRLHAFVDFLGSSLGAFAIMMIAAGVAILVTVAFGCLGALREKPALILVFAILLSALFLLEIAGAVAGFVSRNYVRSEVLARMSSSQRDYSGREDVAVTWDVVQQRFRCCGVRNYTEWYAYLGDYRVPDSCCRNVTDLCGARLLSGEQLYERNCVDGFSSWAESRLFVVAAFGVILALAEIVGVGLAFCLNRSVKSYSKMTISS